EQDIGLLHSLRKLRVDADADVARVAGTAVVEEVLAAERGAERQTATLDPALQLAAGLAGPAAPAKDDEGSFCTGEKLGGLRHLESRCRRTHGVVARHVCDRRLGEQRVLRQ